MELSWPAPASHGSPLTRHELQATVMPATGQPATNGTASASASASASSASASPASASSEPAVLYFVGAPSPSAAGRIAATATGLPPGREVTFRARAVNGLGEGAWGQPLSTRSTAEPPGPPSGLEATEKGLHHLALCWRRGEARGLPTTHHEVSGGE